MNILAILLIAAAAVSEPDLKIQAGSKKNAEATALQDEAAKQYKKLLEKDEAALEQIEKLFLEFDSFATNGAPGSRGALIAKIDGLIDPMKKAYEEFLQHHPNHVEGYIAYGSFLHELGDEEAATVQWEKARELDPKNPTPWNNLANVFGHIGPPKKAFQYYEIAIELDPTEPVYIHNLATTTYLFRKDAVEMYRIDEEGVFNKALELYQRAMKLDPTNIVLATDYAQSYYGIRPLRTNDAISAWNHCLTLAKNDVETEGIHTHLARVKWMAGMLDEAEKHLARVKNPDMAELKDRIQRNIEKKRKGESVAEPDPVAEGKGKSASVDSKAPLDQEVRK